MATSALSLRTQSPSPALAIDAASVLSPSSANGTASSSSPVESAAKAHGAVVVRAAMTSPPPSFDHVHLYRRSVLLCAGLNSLRLAGVLTADGTVAPLTPKTPKSAIVHYTRLAPHPYEGMVQEELGAQFISPSIKYATLRFHREMHEKGRAEHYRLIALIIDYCGIDFPKDKLTRNARPITAADIL